MTSSKRNKEEGDTKLFFPVDNHASAGAFVFPAVVYNNGAQWPDLLGGQHSASMEIRTYTKRRFPLRKPLFPFFCGEDGSTKPFQVATVVPFCYRPNKLKHD